MHSRVRRELRCAQAWTAHMPGIFHLDNDVSHRRVAENDVRAGIAAVTRGLKNFSGVGGIGNSNARNRGSAGSKRP